MKFNPHTINAIVKERENHHLHDIDVYKLDGSVVLVAGSLFHQNEEYNQMVRYYNNLYLKNCGTQKIKIVMKRTNQYDDEDSIHPLSTRMTLIVFVKNNWSKNV